MPLISVVIPLYNKEESIQKTLKSVLDQTYSDYEIVIVNDGSTDNSEGEALKIKSDRIKLFATENKGVSEARNFGIQKSSGELIAFLDADDYWFPNHLQSLFELYKIFPECGLYCTNYEQYYNPKKIYRPRFRKMDSPEWRGIATDFFKSSYIDRIAWTSAVAVPKKIFETAGNFNPNITLGAGEDTDLWIRIALKHKVAFDSQISARHILDAENRISLSKTLARSFAKFEEFAEEEKSNASLKKYLDLYRIEFALKHKLAGDIKTFKFYMKDVSPKNITLKTRIILSLPSSVLKKLFAIKKYLEQKNIHLSAYH